MGSGRDCMRRHASATAWALSLFAVLAANTSHAADLIWEVESPFRFFKPTRAFALHEAAAAGVPQPPSAPARGETHRPPRRGPNRPGAPDPPAPPPRRGPRGQALPEKPPRRGGSDAGRALL